jgi:ATP-dependent DNA ligase
VPVIERDYPSSSSSDVHHAWFDTDSGKSGCSCKGWIYCKTEPRACRHTKDLKASQNGLGVEGQQTSSQGEKSSPSLTSPVRKPMLAVAMPDGCKVEHYAAEVGRFILEEKFDGWRVLVQVDADRYSVSAWTRPRSGKTSNLFPLPAVLNKALLQMPSGLYDGEVLVPGGTSSDVKKKANESKLRIVLFDVLEIMKSDVTDLSYAERRQILELSVGHHTAQCDGNPVVRCPEILPVSMDAVADIWRRGGEGAIIKDLNTRYEPGRRSPYWIKVKRDGSITLKILKFKAGKLGPYSTIVLSKDGATEYTSVKTKDADTMRAIERDPDSFIGRGLVVSYIEKTPDGNLRHPMFDHFEGTGDEEPTSTIVTPTTRKVKL